MSLRVLVVEDEMTIALLLEDMLLELGHSVVAMPMRLEAAIGIAQSAEMDFAILDINLDGAKSYPVAEILRARGVPFAFASGYGSVGVDPPFQDLPVLQKPFSLAQLEHLVALSAVPGQ